MCVRLTHAVRISGKTNKSVVMPFVVWLGSSCNWVQWVAFHQHMAARCIANDGNYFGSFTTTGICLELGFVFEGSIERSKLEQDRP